MRPLQIEAIGVANPPRRCSQDETFQMASYTSARILEIFRNCDIDFKHYYVAPGLIREETAGDLNRYLAPLARILLAIVYTREHKGADALALLVKFRADFPANTVFAKALTRFDRH